MSPTIIAVILCVIAVASSLLTFRYADRHDYPKVYLFAITACFSLIGAIIAVLL